MSVQTFQRRMTWLSFWTWYVDSDYKFLKEEVVTEEKGKKLKRFISFSGWWSSFPSTGLRDDVHMQRQPPEVL